MPRLTCAEWGSSPLCRLDGAIDARKCAIADDPLRSIPDTSMIPVLMSSGDLIADRRADYAEALLPDDPTSAAELYEQALALAPHWTAGWYRLGDIRDKSGLSGAAEAFETALACDPADRLGASLRLDMLLDRSMADAMPPAFVEALFDQYAPKFETALVDQLSYCGPQLMAEQIAGRLGSVLDLGCGTGLMGVELRPRCAELTGWDISAEMLRTCRAKGIYDCLEKRDLNALPAPEQTWDVITAADVFIYLGALEKITGWVAMALRPEGQFVFTVEEHNGPEAYVLRDTCRYAHSAAALQDLLDQAGFDSRMTRAVLRMDRDEPVWGLIVRAAKRNGRSPASTDGHYTARLPA